MPTTPESANFAFLARHDPVLVRLGTLAERCLTDDAQSAPPLAGLTLHFAIAGKLVELDVDQVRPQQPIPPDTNTKGRGL